MNRIAALIASVLVISCDKSASNKNEQDKRSVIKNTDEIAAKKNEMTLSPDQAKAAIIEMLRRSSVLEGMDGAVDHLAKSEIKKINANVIRFGFVTCNLTEKKFTVKIIAPPNIAIYNGKLKHHDPSWEAEIEDVTRN